MNIVILSVLFSLIGNMLLAAPALAPALESNQMPVSPPSSSYDHAAVHVFRGEEEIAALNVEIPVSYAGTTKGLGERPYLPEDQGMLFEMSSRAKHRFWMKGMEFPLDFLWIDGDEIIDMHEGIEPDWPARKIYAPSRPVDRILEVNAGYIEAHDIRIGDTIRVYRK